MYLVIGILLAFALLCYVGPVLYFGYKLNREREKREYRERVKRCMEAKGYKFE